MNSDGDILGFIAMLIGQAIEKVVVLLHNLGKKVDDVLKDDDVIV